ncbi:hypothetical protein BGZ72_002637 [Mortierella alpina]|nr:hypothetical protein BGZ72_002637 [Mortierella alpina]
MKETQPFRLIGTTEIVRIPIQHIDGLATVGWNNIEKAFPGVQCVKNGDVEIPRYIEHFPDDVLDIVLASAPEHNPIGSSVQDPSMASAAAFSSILTFDEADASTDPSPESPSEDGVVEDLQVATALSETPVSDIDACDPSTDLSTLPSSSRSEVRASSKNSLSFRHVVKLATKRANGSDGQVQQKELSAQMAHMIKLQEASDAKHEEMRQLQKQALLWQERMEQLQKQVLDHQQEMQQLALDHHEEMRQLQIQALGQLAVLQDRVKAVLTQTYELHEYPIPRLFIVLPEDPSKWDTVNPFTNKFRVYFLCECGEHTKSANSQSNIPHHIHLAKHEGYEIKRPTEFFQRYGAYALIILKMLKFGITVAGVAVPALPFLISAESMGQITTSFKYWEENIELGVNRAIGYIDDTLEHDGAAVQVENKEALEGADLRKLETFLTHKDGGKVLGNLFRTVTDEGHVKWVCDDHYRESYQESNAKHFQRAVDSVGGLFDKNMGRVEVTLPSKVLAEQFSLALEKARSVFELDVNFDWACTTSDLEVLEGALRQSRVSILRLTTLQFRTSNLSLTTAQYGVLFRIQKLPSLRVLHVVISKNITKVISNRPKTSSCLCKLSIIIVPGSLREKEIADLAEALKTNLSLTTLDLQGNAIGNDGAKALAAALEINSTMTTLNLTDNDIGPLGANALAEALKTNSTLTTLNLRGNAIGDDGAKALAAALKINSTMTTLNLTYNGIGPLGANALAEALKTNSTLTALNLSLNNIQYDGAKALGEALKTNSTLTDLNLNYNSIRDNGTKELAEALKTNISLTTLSLNGNSIGNNGAQALAEALKTNSTLTTMSLDKNLIRGDGAEALAEALKTNLTLTTMSLDNNWIGDDGAKALMKTCKANSVFITLNSQG